MPPKKAPTNDQQIVLLGRHKGSLKMGLVGLPNVGKSTTFNLLSKQSVPAENFPFCTIDPHQARMNVPDERFKWLCELFKPRSQVPAHLTIYDIAGLVPGAHKGEGLGNAFLSHIQEVDGIFHVVRCFVDVDIIHTEGEVDPVKDLETINNELRLKDLERLTRLVDEHKKIRIKDRAKLATEAILIAIHDHVNSGKWINTGSWKAAEADVINEHQFLTAKPVVYLLNISENEYRRQSIKGVAKIHQWIKENNPGPIIPYCAGFELKLAELPSEGARAQYLKENGFQKSMLDKIITSGYSALHLLHYFTCGEDEVRCWTIRQGTKAPQAAGLIHTDFEKGFICADVYKYSDIYELGNEAAVKAAGKMMQKGKDYVVEDGDIIFYKFNPSGGGKK